ncbi:Lrp/AsnC family transcriptional regulator [Flaviflagellibacter deserti]|jgi:Lrp/AsnC family transcriptional regulator, leucine-responsive regulatory protein|uniref:Lrp/AsnC family transcriptional regulator n=1 Tax=Flaviflagellibacter deserti TaxID=2267266 RepID=A0ABV9Z4L1_9HYPH
MQKQNFDAATIRIIDALQTNSEISLADLAKDVGLSQSPCWRRVSELKKNEVIQRSVAVVDPAALGLTVNVFVHVSLEKQNKESLSIFERAIAKRPEVMECYLMSGDSDYLLRVVAEDLSKYQEFVIDVLTQIPVVSSIRSSFALSRVKYTTALPTAHLV